MEIIAVRAFELVLIIATIAATLRFRYALIQKMSRHVLIACLLAVVAAVLQGVVELPRWQLLPCYLAVLLLIATAISHTSKLKSDEQTLRTVRQLLPFNLILCVATGLLVFLAPVAELPRPTGPYSVATVSYDLTDTKRNETFCKDANAKRRLAVQIWYPAQAPRGSCASFMSYCADPGPFLKAPIWATLASHLYLVPTSSWIEAPISMNQARFPVLIFSHGILGGRIQNTSQIQELASHGYVVVGIDHTYDASFTIFSPTESIPSGLLANSLGPDGNTAVKIRDTGIYVRVADVQFVLDELAKLNAEDPKKILAGHLDLEKVGVFGHSFGGATTMGACAVDDRVRSGLAMDGCISDERIELLSKPLFIMKMPREGEDPIGTKRLSKKCSGPFWDVNIAGTAHGNFTDLAFLTPAHRLSMLTGTIEPMRALIIMNAYTLAFFDYTLLGKASALLDGPSAEFNEVTFDSMPKKSSP